MGLHAIGGPSSEIVITERDRASDVVLLELPDWHRGRFRERISLAGGRFLQEAATRLRLLENGTIQTTLAASGFFENFINSAVSILLLINTAAPSLVASKDNRRICDGLA